MLMRLTPGERELFEHVADAAGVPLSTWARDTLMSGALASLDLLAARKDPHG